MRSLGFVRAEDWKPVGIGSLEPNAMVAVRATGNTLVTAGPGAGKTELLGQRGVFVLQTGACVDPRRLLAISFKRDAARNLRERFERRCTREQARRLDSLTFDAFAKQILDRFWRALPDPWTLTRPYRVSRMLAKNEFFDLQQTIATTLNDPDRAAGWTVKYLGRGPKASQVHEVNYEQFNLAIHDLTLCPPALKTVSAFLQLVQFRRAFEQDPVPLTFPMIGRLAQIIVTSNPKILAAIRATYSHLFMDEFQDTTGVQYGLMKSIFYGSATIITAVGDDKQKIMGWAGAQKDGFGAFKTDFLKEGASANQAYVTLSLNYRSNARIVEVLNALKKKLAPTEPDFVALRAAPNLPPEKICSVISSPDSVGEAEGIAVFIARELQSGLAPRSVGLLVRQKAADWEKALAPAFIKHGITLRNEDRDVGGASIQDLMTEPYAEAVIDGLDLLLRQRGGAMWTRVLDKLSDMEGIVAEEEAEVVQEIVHKLDEFHKTHRIKNANSAVTSGDAIKRLELVEQFFGVAALKASAPQYQHGEFFDGVRMATKTFLKECAIGSASWRDMLVRYRGEHQVPLMTITKSKGLEYDLVLLLGLDDQQWWSFKLNPSEGHSTFFVAASRARERLFMTLCRDKQTSKVTEIYGLLQQAGVGVLKVEDLVKS